MQADIDALFPGEEIVRVRGIHVYADDTAGNSVSWTDLRFSNAVTTRSSLLSPGGAIGHVARARTIDPADWSVDDAYPHYDQVGSVVAATGADGLAAVRREADAWGNDLASWSTGLWAAPAGGWGHNTKAFDPAADLVYMYQRWYDPKTGTFASSAPYPPMIEHRYGFAENNPVQAFDPYGEDVWYGEAPVGGTGLVYHAYFIIGDDMYIDRAGYLRGGQFYDMSNSSGKAGATGPERDRLEQRRRDTYNVNLRRIELLDDVQEEWLLQYFKAGYQNQGIYMPVLNDCHNKAARAARYAHIPPGQGIGGRRVARQQGLLAPVSDVANEVASVAGKVSNFVTRNIWRRRSWDD